MYKSELSPECLELIRNLARKGMRYTQILRECKKKNFKISYAQVVYHAKKTEYSFVEKQHINLEFIQSTTELCKEMTFWLRKMIKQYDKIKIVKNKSKFAYHINKVFENFVDLLKTPAIQKTQVNVLQQQLEQSLKDVIDERTSEFNKFKI